jgi:hypothetical protein
MTATETQIALTEKHIVLTVAQVPATEKQTTSTETQIVPTEKHIVPTVPQVPPTEKQTVPPATQTLPTEKQMTATLPQITAPVSQLNRVVVARTPSVCLTESSVAHDLLTSVITYQQPNILSCPNSHSRPSSGILTPAYPKPTQP